MKVQIVGAGAVGMLFGSYLVERGITVHFVCRNKEQIIRLNNRLSRENPDGTIDYFAASASKNVLPDVDLTIVAVKSRDVEAILPLLPEDGPVLFLQNGLAHFELLKKSNLQCTAFGSVQFGASKLSDELVSQRGIGVVKIAKGTFSQSMLREISNWNNEQLPIEIVEDAEKMLYEKAIYNSLINPLTAMLNVPNGELIRNEYALHLMKKIHAELSVNFSEYCPSFEEVCALCERTASNTSSMLADHRNHRQSEIKEIVGVLLDKAASKKNTLPTLETVYNFVLAKELSEGYDG